MRGWWLFGLVSAIGCGPAPAPEVSSGPKPWLALTSREAADRLLATSGLPARWVEVAGSRVRFIDSAPTPQPGDPPATLLIHGLGGSLGDWGPLFSLARKAGRAVALDLPGFGASVSYDQDYEIQTYVRVLERFIEAGGLGAPHLVCHSMGGQICLAFALFKPSSVTSLTLIDAAGTYDPSAFLKAVSRRVADINVGAVDTQRNPAIELLTAHDQEVLKRIIGDDPFLFAAWSSFGESFRKRVKDLRVPTLVIWGIDDPLFGVGQAFFLKENIPGAVLHLLDGAGHNPHLEDPALVWRWIDAHHQRVVGASHEE